jgi:hypothetical protein
MTVSFDAEHGDSLNDLDIRLNFYREISEVVGNRQEALEKLSGGQPPAPE